MSGYKSVMLRDGIEPVRVQTHVGLDALRDRATVGERARVSQPVRD